MNDKLFITIPEVINLKMTEDEYGHIQSLLHIFMSEIEYDETDLKWYDYKYISQALEYARKEGEKNENDQ